MAFASVGTALRAERVRQGRTLADLAQRTRISAKFLGEIENDNFDGLPGTVFTRNFVKSYATELGMDPDPFVSALPRVQVAEPSVPVPVTRESPQNWDPRWNSSLSSAAWIILAVGAAVFAYLHFNKPAPNLPPRPAIVAKSAKQDVQQIAKDNPPAETRPAAAVTPVPVPAANPDSAAASPVDTHPVQVVLTGNQRSWVQIIADGKSMFSGILQQDEKKEVSADDSVKVVMGNAAGVAITLNGKPLDSMGAAGEVRTVKLTAEGPQLVSKAPPPFFDPL